ncbi:hypothetical protein [Geosporobacter ferrireducens]|uniref:DUF4013 domain-containing protein n=1 Tax=Geosporobacter ferrireducens TaxID=1424294 RepID=A0A1D8GD17_9FIRM|nr:hypothetical protein [Geosporobacter ferrireducens]AOT68793.1 hypothetical protein Gferi_03990 [Geosporobacter ferrireducens]MTI56449.1 hypothetical protein [Geosporobacter ferrireducens]
MNILQDILETNKDVLKKSIPLTLNNWPILFTGLVYSVIILFLFRIAFLFWILAGILVTLVQSALISNYLYLIENIIRYGKISIEDFKRGFTVYIWKIYGIMVVIWFVNYGLSLFLSPLLRMQVAFVSLGSLIQLAAFVLLNCLPEVIYQKHFMAGESFSYCVEFIKENWLDWFVPNILLGILFFALTGRALTANLLIGNSLIRPSINGIIFYLVGQLFLSFIMIYRGLLFQALSGSTRRKRMYMRNMYRP